MRIHHLVLTSRFAGSERYALELAQAQAASGHEVTLVLRGAALGQRADSLASRLPDGVRVAVVPDWFSAWHARRLLRRERPDAAHAHLSAACKALAGIAGMARAATLHIAYKPRQHAHLDGVVAITPGQLAALPATLRERSVHIDNWTQLKEAAADSRERLRASLGVAADVVLLGTLGRVESSKGHDLLLEAFKDAGFGKQVQLVVVGGGSALQALRRSSPPGVHPVGFSDEPSGWLQAMDGFVSAARSEPFGLVFLEAMEAGLPILATDTEGGRHLAALFGRPLVPVGDVPALRDALRNFVDSGLVRRDYPMARFRLDDKLPTFDAFYRGLRADA